MSTRRRFSGDFKAKVALEALRGDVNALRGDVNTIRDDIKTILLRLPIPNETGMTVRGAP